MTPTGWNTSSNVGSGLFAISALRLKNLHRAALFVLGAALWFLPAFCRAQLAQSIVFTQPPPAQAYAGTSVVLAATATSGLPVTFSVASGPAQVSGANGSTLTFTGVGSVVVQADQAGGNGYSAAPSVQAPATNVLLLTEPVTTQSPSIATIVTFTAPGTLSQISALTQGATNLDYSLPLAAGSTCVTGIAYTAGQTCIVHFAFQPTRPGVRYGGIVLTDATGNVLANHYIYGYGVGPEVLYEPYVQSQIGNSLGIPSGVAINGKGDLFVSNNSGTTTGLVEIAANGTVSVIGSFDPGKDVVIDGSGNVFVVTQTTLYEVVAVNGSIPANPVILTLATGFDVDGGGLAVDGSGNAYIAQTPVTSTAANPQGVLFAVYAVDGVIPLNSAKHQIGPVLGSPTGVAVDSSGNLYISNETPAAIYEMLAVNGRVPASPTVLTIGSGYVGPSNIRLDDTNDIFISDALLPGVLEFVAVNGVVPANAPPKSIGSGFNFPEGLLVDDSGNVFVADGGFPEVIKLNYSNVPTLTFNPTVIGQTSSDSPKAASYTNAGNAPLVFSTPLTGTNPTFVTTSNSFTFSNASTCPQLTPSSGQATLAVGATCTDIVSFTPTAAGPQTGSLTTVDNDLSVSNATQVIPLSGIGLLIPPTIQFSVGNHFVDDAPFSVTATSNSPAAITYSVQSGPATIAGNTVTLAGTPGTVTLLASQAPSLPYAAGSASATFSVIKHSQTINFTPPPTPVLPSASPLTLVASATSGLPVVFSVLSGPGTITGNRLTFTGYGLITVAADQPGNAIYNAAPEVTHTVFVLDNRVAVTLTGAPNPVFVTNPVTFTATVSAPSGTPTGSIQFVDGTTVLATVPLNGLTASFTTSSLAAGTHVMTAVYSGDAIFATATSAPFVELVEDFSFVITNPNVTINHGGTAVYNFVVTTIGGAYMASTIQFSITGNPDHSPLTFSPAQVATGSGTTNGTITIVTPDYPVGPFVRNTAPLASPGSRTASGIALATLTFGLLLATGRKRRALRSRIAVLLLALGLSVAATMLSSCAAGWQAQPYPMTVTASSGSLSHSVNIRLVSQ